MYIRQLRNCSGSISIQIISKSRGKYKVAYIVGYTITQYEIDTLILLAKKQTGELSQRTMLFPFQNDEVVDQVSASLAYLNIRRVGPELIFGRISDFIGFNKIDNQIFHHLINSRLAFPLSKLKTIDYVFRYQGVALDIDAVYRYSDK